MDSGIYIAVVSILVLLSYVYWRQLKQRLDSAFKAYDIVFLTIIFTYVIAKLAWQLQSSPTGLSLIGLIDPRKGEWAYLTLIYIPLFAFQMRMQWRDRARLWKNQALFIVVYSLGTVLFLSILDLILRIINSAAIDWLTLVGTWLITILSLIIIARRRSQAKSIPRMLVSLFFLQQIGLQSLIWMSAVRYEYKVVLAMIYFGLMFVPAIGLIGGEQRNHEPKPN